MYKLPLLPVLLTALVAVSPAAAHPRADTLKLPAEFALPHSAVSGPDGAMWVTDSSLGRIWRIAKHDKVRHYALGEQPAGITTAYGSMWVADASGDAIHRAVRQPTYSIESSSTEAPTPIWDPLPYVRMEVAGPRGRVQVAAWPREGADVQRPSFSFADTEEGELARRQALRAWARGEEAVVASGATLRLQAPQAMRDLMPDVSALGAGTIRMPPSQPFEAELEVVTASETLSYRFEVRTVPPTLARSVRWLATSAKRSSRSTSPLRRAAGRGRWWRSRPAAAGRRATSPTERRSTSSPSWWSRSRRSRRTPTGS